MTGHLDTLRDELSDRIVNNLIRGGFSTLGQVEQATDLELTICRDLGVRQLEIIRSYLRQREAAS